MVSDSRKNELYNAPEIDVFEVECEGVFCDSNLENPEEGDSM